MINALSDGIMIAVILLVSAAAVLIALLCIRFALLAEIEEDYREIGVMRGPWPPPFLHTAYLSGQICPFSRIGLPGRLSSFPFPCRDMLPLQI